MKNSIIIYILLFTTQLLIVEANNEIDRLNQLLPNLENKEKIDVLNELSKLNRPLSIKRAYDDAVSAQFLADEIDDKKGLANSKMNIGIIKSIVGKNINAIEFISTARLLFEEIDDIVGLAYSLNALGKINSELGNYIISEEYLNESLKHKIFIGDSNQIAVTYHNLGLLYINSEDYTKAVDSYTKALDIYSDLSDSFNLANCYNDIGRIYLELEEYNKANINFNFAFKIFRILKDETSIAISNNNLAVLYLNHQNYKDAKYHLNNALQTYIDNNDKNKLAGSYYNLAEIYQEENNIKKTIEYLNLSTRYYQKISDQKGIADNQVKLASILVNTDTDKSLDLLNKAFTYYQTQKIYLRSINVLNMQSQIYSNQGDFASVLITKDLLIESHKKESLNNSRLLAERIQSKERAKSIYMIQQKEIKLQEAEITNLNYTLYLIALGLFFTLTTTMLTSIYYYKLKNKNKQLRAYIFQLSNINYQLKNNLTPYLFIISDKLNNTTKMQTKQIQVVYNEFVNKFNSLLRFIK